MWVTVMKSGNSRADEFSARVKAFLSVAAAFRESNDWLARESERGEKNPRLMHNERAREARRQYRSKKKR
jgi:hypothetical protein